MFFIITDNRKENPILICNNMKEVRDTVNYCQREGLTVWGIIEGKQVRVKDEKKEV